MSDQNERTEMQRTIYNFVSQWYEGLGLEYEGASLGECLKYNLTQLVNQKVLQELHDQSSS